MRNMSDIIEAYLKQKIEESHNERVEIKRAQIAEKFDCVPSQLNYVIKTRFTNELGYIVESKRGGGGYIRITKIETHAKADYLEHILGLIGDRLSQINAQHLIQSMYDREVITYNEARIMDRIILRETLLIDLPERDILRAHIMRNIIEAILYEE
ncbi:MULTISPECIES: CtsR family transcriptional regulator [Nosocomiicoccus]|uniref:Transcriptional regulator CtsR n=2 Tax=Bacilli TaxID=91061 RepID=A0AAF0YKS9_9STAP|nr:MULTISPECIES: CtsR family transcriptional regulator [Nosocomiicoccus]MDK6863669.1 CtsR family transcriptional regulator [Nosocomiicoccus ampullae]OFL49398.1 CtsR family transcriptional regulator [Nosocomiicoccus sp. HMSC067E10]OFO49888.1 CtsR family transcriptional regulator [Nosocomiicoccus sp. HMSC059G07]OFS61524.1 CtsR family transcriptional regulator [Nosocomiicoccus sp. HMSC09A07]WOS95564.1 CtsR family transcriptional regulator [Nosocomiicoccus massiliensis]